MNLLRRIFIVAAVAALCATVASAGPYTDDLSKCLVDSTSKEDRTDLVKWMFAAASRHPAVESIAVVSEDELDDANKKFANLMTTLLTESCKEEAQKALKYEGDVAMFVSFKVLGQVAAQELFASPEVAGALSGLEKHLDQEKLQSLVEPS